jgi:hypothetical protein
MGVRDCVALCRSETTVSDWRSAAICAREVLSVGGGRGCVALPWRLHCGDEPLLPSPVAVKPKSRRTFSAATKESSGLKTTGRFAAMLNVTRRLRAVCSAGGACGSWPELWSNRAFADCSLAGILYAINTFMLYAITTLAGDLSGLILGVTVSDEGGSMFRMHGAEFLLG